ncbi:MAG: NAD-dependent epimerase/dehydratase family protein [Cyclobacteriaceae bacterium]|jgi:nucleoside-diphosphate-sugar epimerase|nr:NAD-dependent epimerase/dehydratase family protein [Cytophagales bacterium]MCZ8328735.1 NAD-dependent epimerase/dehydratase family protein [Cyclobacteriaceae bacterium]
MKKHKILIIGAGGQLGSELTQGLWQIYGKENVIATDIKDPQGILAQGNFEILDVLKEKALFEFIKKNNITQIYHLAAVLSATGERNPKFAWHLNMDGLVHVLDAAVEFKLDRVYWPSSIAAFGPTTPKQNTPQDTIMDPTTIYGITKLAGERWCDWYFRNKGVDVRSLRYPGLIGYKTKPGGGTTDYAVDIYIKALTDKKFECFLSEHTYLPMMYMDDAVKATLDIMEAPAEKVKIRSSYNVSAMSFSPAEIAKSIQKHIPEFTISYQPDFRQSIADSWPQSLDDMRARQDWGWQPAFDLDKMTAEILKHLPAYL